MSEEVNWNEPMWEREAPRKFWDPARKLLKTIRDYQRISSSRCPCAFFLKRICVVRYNFWRIVTGAEIDLTSEIGGGLLLLHPNGIVLHPDSVIGVNCLIFQQVTFAGAVTIGNHVDVGAGAKIMGPLTIGNNVQIGANSVVTKDVPDGAVMVGIPARQLNAK